MSQETNARDDDWFVRAFVRRLTTVRSIGTLEHLEGCHAVLRCPENKVSYIYDVYGHERARTLGEGSQFFNE